MTAQDWDCAESLLAAMTPLPAGEDTAGEDKAVNGSAEHGIPRHRYLEVARHIASGDISKAELARRFGCRTDYVGEMFRWRAASTCRAEAYTRPEQSYP